MTQEDNLIVQSQISIAFLVELKNNNFLKSSFYDSMKFGVPEYKNVISTIGIDNQGTLLLALYSMLVIPKQLIEKEFTKQFDEVNIKLQQYIMTEETTYKKDQKAKIINYLHRIRNAVAHARVEFDPNNIVTFTDNNPQTTEYCVLKIKLDDIGYFLTQLQSIFMEYYKKRLAEQNNK
jgi:intein/homing endonuclease